MRTCALPALIVLVVAGVSVAAEPATRPVSIVDLPRLPESSQWQAALLTPGAARAILLAGQQSSAGGFAGVVAGSTPPVFAVVDLSAVVATVSPFEPPASATQAVSTSPATTKPKAPVDLQVSPPAELTLSTLGSPTGEVIIRGVRQGGGRTLVWGERPTRRGRDAVPAVPDAKVLNLPLVGPLAVESPTKPKRNNPVPYVAVWDAARPGEVVRFDDREDYAVRAAALTNDGRFALTVQDFGPLRLWDATTGKLLRTVDAGKRTNALALFADGRRAVIGGGMGDEKVYVWDLLANRPLLVCEGHHGIVTSVAVSPDERFVLSTSLDGSTRLWDAATGAELRRLRPMGLPVLRAVFSPDGRRVLSTLAERPRDMTVNQAIWHLEPGSDLRLWDLDAGEVIYQYDTRGMAVRDAVFTADGRGVVAVAGGQAFAWRAPANVTTNVAAATRPAAATSPTTRPDPLLTPILPGGPTGVAHALGDDFVSLVGFLPDGRAFAAGEQNRVAHWDLARQFRRARFEPAEQLDDSEVAGLSADGRIALSLRPTGSNEAYVWEPGSGLTLSRPKTTSVIRAAAISPDGTLVALGTAGGGQFGGRVRRNAPAFGDAARVEFFRTNGGGAAGTIDVSGYDPSFVRFTPDGNRILLPGTTEQTAAGEFDLDSGKLAATYVAASADIPRTFAYSADGHWLAAIGPRGVTVWDTASGRRVLHLLMTVEVTAVALSSDGRRLATGGVDSNVRVFDVDGGKAVVRWDEPKLAPASLAFSPDGQRLICGSRERVLRVFELPAE